MSSLTLRQGRDGTLERNTVKQWEFLISDYQIIKQKRHSHFRFVTDFYKFHNLKRQNFIKYYNRYKNSGFSDSSSLFPRARGPRYSHRRVVSQSIEEQIVCMRRERGLSRYEIRRELSAGLGEASIPSHSSIYNTFKRHNINKLNHNMVQNSKRTIRKIIKELPGDMGHIDCHYLPRNMIVGDSSRYYLLALVDDCTRLAWVKLMKDIQSLTVMFNTLEIMTLFKNKYQVEFKEILSDNGSEFGGGPEKKNKYTNPFERLMSELEIKHRYTLPYRPQTNGKVERFWKTINEDLFEEMVFDNLEHMQEEIIRYCLYYNEMRPHAAIENKTPLEYLKSRQK